ncbi:UDP-N-acetylglucosamine 2-epimerase (non-hydrolyzing) [candidate division KSB1 bacterium]|nr:UDP-N-acetylglucosamine 2-epimerase (non-hydrolyzing) [candidate division KSB1 bacterium]
MIRIVNIVGARPNFMKIAPIHRRMLKRSEFSAKLIHTGQHYDEKMSKTFFEELGMPEPDIYLGIGSGSHAVQTAGVMIELEKILSKEKPDLVLVVGDVNSTLAAAIVASKLHVKVGHVEAGLRSFDRSMPEEINRILTDSISEMLFVTEQSGLDNLANEGKDDNQVFFVGNVMIDSLVEHLEKAQDSTILQDLGLQPRNYVAMTLHRPSNVDHKESLGRILQVIHKIQQELAVVLPIHPRTRKMIEHFGFQDDVAQMKGLHLLDPMGYLDFLRLMSQSRVVLTDSGGIQEETTYLGIPCITLRENTERPVTITLGTNQLVGTQPEQLIKAFDAALHGQPKDHQVPPLWDGKASERIIDILQSQL